MDKLIFYGCLAIAVLALVGAGAIVFSSPATGQTATAMGGNPLVAHHDAALCDITVPPCGGHNDNQCPNWPNC
jgi:hypothetical protein